MYKIGTFRFENEVKGTRVIIQAQYLEGAVMPRYWVHVWEDITQMPLAVFTVDVEGNVLNIEKENPDYCEKNDLAEIILSQARISN